MDDNSKTSLFFYDKEKAYANYGSQFAKRLLNSFWNEEPYQDIHKMMSAINEFDVDQVLNILHRIKVNFSLVGLENLYQEADTLYAKLRENQDDRVTLARLKEVLLGFFSHEEQLRELMLSDL